MDRAAPAVVLVSVILFLLATVGYVGLMIPVMLPDTLSTRLITISSWLLDHLPREAFNVLMGGLVYVALVTSFLGCAVSLITGIRAWRKGPLSRRTIALTTCGGVLGILLSGGPLGAHAYIRGSLDRSVEASRQTFERMRERLETGQVPAPQRHHVWLLYARGVYWDRGIQVQIPDENGGTTIYQPSSSDVAARASYLDLLKRFRPPYRFTVFVLIFVACSVAIGLVTPLRHEPSIPLR